MQKMLPIIAGGLLVVVIALVVVLFLTQSGGGGGEEAVAPEAAAEVALPPPPAAGEHGPDYPIAGRVVNLADPGGRRYLKVSLSLEFNEQLAEDDGGGGHGGAGSPLETWRTGIAHEMGPLLQDALTTVLASKTSAELLTPEGKEHLREEIIHHINEVLHAERIRNVYFTDFIIQ